MQLKIYVVLLVCLVPFLFPITSFASPADPSFIQDQFFQQPEPTPSPGIETQTTPQGDNPINSIEEALGTLGIFAAFMLILALGTEAVIDAVKVATGFKSKPTALETVNKLREWLPGQLEDMGSDAAAVRQLNKTLDSLSTHMTTLDKASTMAATVDQWLGNALKDLAIGNVEQILERKLPFLRQELKKTGLPDLDITIVEAWLKGAVATLKATTAKELMGQVQGFIRLLQQPQKLEKEIIKALETWLPQQVSRLTSRAAQDLLENEIPKLVDKLKDLQLSEDAILQIEVWVSGAISYLDSSSSNAYTVALTNVLQTVEDRREAIHSPIRKVWRWINQHWIKQKWGFTQKPRPTDRIILPLNPATIARTLAQRDDSHRDEEISRLRWLRVVSILVGLGLAILLHIDVGDILKPIITTELFSVLTYRLGTPFASIAAHQIWAGWWIFWRIPWWINNLLSSVSIGILVSGLAASAGSAFWHDILERLQTSKKAVGEVSDLVEQLRKLETGSG